VQGRAEAGKMWRERPDVEGRGTHAG